MSLVSILVLLTFFCALWIINPSSDLLQPDPKPRSPETRQRKRCWRQRRRRRKWRRTFSRDGGQLQRRRADALCASPGAAAPRPLRPAERADGRRRRRRLGAR